MGKASRNLATVSARIGVHVGVFLLIVGLLTATAFVLPLPISAEGVVVWAVPAFGLIWHASLFTKGFIKGIARAPQGNGRSDEKAEISHVVAFCAADV